MHKTAIEIRRLVKMGDDYLPEYPEPEPHFLKKWQVVIAIVFTMYVGGSLGMIYAMKQTMDKYYERMIMVEQDYAELINRLGIVRGPE
jgi:hypothetical protein